MANVGKLLDLACIEWEGSSQFNLSNMMMMNNTSLNL